jgi:hypothetical protein
MAVRQRTDVELLGELGAIATAAAERLRARSAAGAGPLGERGAATGLGVGLMRAFSSAGRLPGVHRSARSQGRTAGAGQERGIACGFPQPHRARPNDYTRRRRFSGTTNQRVAIDPPATTPAIGVTAPPNTTSEIRTRMLVRPTLRNSDAAIARLFPVRTRYALWPWWNRSRWWIDGAIRSTEEVAIHISVTK